MNSSRPAQVPARVRVNGLHACAGSYDSLVKVKRVSILVVAFAVSAASAQAGDLKVRGPWPLVAVGALGSVTWRCDPTQKPGLAPGLPGLALGFHITGGQTGTLRLRVALRTVVNRVVQPGQTVALPFLHARVQTLELTESGEDGTLRAVVTVDFERGAPSSYCWSYMPPRVDLQLAPRR